MRRTGPWRQLWRCDGQAECRVATSKLVELVLVVSVAGRPLIVELVRFWCEGQGLLEKTAAASRLVAFSSRFIIQLDS